MNNIELHIFTNSTYYITTKQTIFETFKSFVETFGYIRPTIWLDPNPNNDPAVVNYYINSIKSNIDCDLKFSQSLSDGYITAIESCKTPFMFMLEHDWIFKNNILHSLEQICNNIINTNISHLKFNRITNNESHVYTSYNCYAEIKVNDMEVCLTRSASNNPHILYLPNYSKLCLPKIKREHGSYGIEQRLDGTNLGFAVYGGLNHPSTIIHTNGCNNLIIQ